MPNRNTNAYNQIENSPRSKSPMARLRDELEVYNWEIVEKGIIS